MRKVVSLLGIIGSVVSAVASPVSVQNAKSFAGAFYTQHTKLEPGTISLAYVETNVSGDSLYYAFNINQNDGFVIVSADDAANPLIGYSTNGQFIPPVAGSTVGAWLLKRKNELIAIRNNKYKATPEITEQWNLTSTNKNKNSLSTLSSGVDPLCTTTWNQSPYYNDSCPGGSVTGCVATTMAQIMAFWKYPLHGTGSSSYCDCSSGGYTENYGTLSAELVQYAK
jgi:hypothetical protein